VFYDNYLRMVMSNVTFIFLDKIRTNT